MALTQTDSVYPGLHDLGICLYCSHEREAHDGWEDIARKCMIEGCQCEKYKSKNFMARLQPKPVALIDGPTLEEIVRIGQVMNSNAEFWQKKKALADHVMESLPLKTLEDTDEILFYDPSGFYKPGGENKIKSELTAVAGSQVDNRMRSEVLAEIRSKTYVPRGAFDADPDIRNLNNGLYNVRTGHFSRHAPEFLSRVQLPVQYDPKATCRPVIEALYNSFEDPKDVPLYLEWLAYNVFWRGKELQKELLLVGPPECGKSTILNTQIALLGSQNVSAVTFQQLSSNRFALAQLDGKLANIYADITHTRVEDLERFKAIATADEVEAERKGLQLFKFRPEAKQTYSCNIPPRPPLNVDDSFYRRWIIIKCAWRENDYFTGKPRVKDRKASEMLTRPENLSGLFNLLIVSGRRLLEKSRFCKEPHADQTREEYERLSNPVQLWVEERTSDTDDRDDASNQEAYADYVKFCKARRIGPLSDAWFAKELVTLGYTHRQLGQGKAKKRVWNDLKLVTGRGSSATGTLFLSEEVTGKAPCTQTPMSAIHRGETPLPVTSEQSPEPTTGETNS